MKKEILTLIIGILIGAIITTGVFLVLKGSMNESRGNIQSMGEPPEMNGVDMNEIRGKGRLDENQVTNNILDESNS